MDNFVSKFVSIDIETTGLDADTCDIIEIGAVIDDWLDPLLEPPTFHCYVLSDMYKGQPMALSMHPTIFRRIATKDNGYTYHYPRAAAMYLGEWMKNNGAYTPDPDHPEREARAIVAGKNFAMFDDRFLRTLPDFDSHVKYHHRILDPGMLYWNPLTDTKPPGTETCMKRAGLDGEVAHTALEDALIVAKLIHIAVGRMVQASRLLEVLTDRNETVK